jgi:siroheme synthase
VSTSAVVEMIGAGPGDPDLVTLRAETALAAATVVVTDAAVAHLVRAFGPAARAVVSAGGGTDHATVTRAATVDGDTIAVLVGAARRGERVVRLYRGDPWLHPAYAVESAMLVAFGIELVTVPGPAVELALPTAAGVPVHDRARSVTVTVASPATLPPAADPARTIVTVTDDAAGLAAGLIQEGARPDLAVVAAFGGDVSVQRGTPAEIAAAPTVGAGVVVAGAVVVAPLVAVAVAGPVARPAAADTEE